MSLTGSRRLAVALSSTALMGLSALAVPGTAGAAEVDCDPADVTYSVTGGSIKWGFKQSFRSYLTGPIAGGEWTLNGNTAFDGAETGADGGFVWPVVGGTVDGTDSAIASAAEGDTVHLYGHHGALDTTLSNPTVEINGTEGVLKIDFEGFELDTSGATPVPVSGDQVVAATFDLSEAANFHNAGQVTVTSPTAIIGDDFVPAFGMYGPGTAVDPVTAVLDITSTCNAEPGDGNPGEGEPGDGTIPGDNNNGGGIFGSLGTILGYIGS